MSKGGDTLMPRLPATAGLYRMPLKGLKSAMGVRVGAGVVERV